MKYLFRYRISRNRWIYCMGARRRYILHQLCSSNVKFYKEPFYHNSQAYNPLIWLYPSHCKHSQNLPIHSTILSPRSSSSKELNYNTCCLRITISLLAIFARWLLSKLVHVKATTKLGSWIRYKRVCGCLIQMIWPRSSMLLILWNFSYSS